MRTMQGSFAGRTFANTAACVDSILSEHFGYLSDSVKLDRYRRALAYVVRSGDVAVDLGCGSAILGLMCLRSGAGSVYAIEEGTIIQVARRAVAEAGFADQVQILSGRSYDVELPERADVVVCDHVGYFGFDYGVVELFADARRRFLKPGGILVPSEIHLSVAAVDSPTCREHIQRWRQGGIPAEYRWVGEVVANDKRAVTLQADELLSPAAPLATLVLGEDLPPFVSWTAEMTCERDGMLDGIAGWFDCRLAGDVWMTNSPLAHERLNRNQALLPLQEAVQVRAGERLRVTVMARQQDHVLGWVIELPDTGREYRHSTGLLLDQASLARGGPQRIARPNRRAAALQVVLGYCDGTRTVGEIEQLVRDQHPSLLNSDHELASFVRQALLWNTV